MKCDYVKNRIKYQIRKVKKVIIRNESYIAYYKTAIKAGTETPTTRQYLAQNEVFLKSMQDELAKLETELAAL